MYCRALPLSGSSWFLCRGARAGYDASIDQNKDPYLDFDGGCRRAFGRMAIVRLWFRAAYSSADSFVVPQFSFRSRFRSSLLIDSIFRFLPAVVRRRVVD